MVLDIIVVLIYLAAMVGVGWIGMRRARTTEDYLVAGRRLGRNQRHHAVVVIELPKLMPGLGMVWMLTHLLFQQLARGAYVPLTELIRAEDSCLGLWQPLGESPERRVQRGGE